MRVRTVAPAKINWTLEVLGKRDDGYHEIRSVMQTIELCDEVTVSTGKEEGRGKKEEGSVVRAGSVTLVVRGDHEATEDDLTLRAVRALEEATGRELPVVISLAKRIPVAAGLGGGSSDAAAVLRAVDRLYGLGLSREELAGIGAGIGSDVPFFLSGGTALAEGRGEGITALPDAPAAWLVVVVPPIRLAEKTKRMYEGLKADDFTNGQRTEALVERLRRGETVRDGDLFIAFERAAYASFSGLAGYRDALVAAGAETAHLSGAGPGLFAVFGTRGEAETVAGVLVGSDARVFVARTLGAEEATAVVVSEWRAKRAVARADGLSADG
jgi:4-diphosphocytidyl-2-C-methyl-D-erythritol kinase